MKKAFDETMLLNAVHIVKLLLFAFIIFALYKSCGYFKNNLWHYEPNKNRTSLIYSLKTQSETRGAFILGIGTISGEDYYVFYRKTPSGGLIREKIKTSNCILYEGYAQPLIIETGQMGYYLENGDTTKTSFLREDYSSYQSIYIPKGTITERVNIDIN